MSNEIFILKFLISAACLSIASYSDWKTREIDDRIWLILGISGLGLSAADLALGGTGRSLFFAILSVFTAFSLGFLLYRIGFIGGADAKALLALGLTFPVYPLNDYIYPVLPIHPVMMLTIIDNILVLASLTFLFHLSRNLLSASKGEKLFNYKISYWKKILLLVSAVKLDIRKTDWDKNFPLERPNFSEEPYRVDLTVLPNIHEEVDKGSLIRGLETGLLPSKIWASPGLPMVIFITLGLVVSLFYGDLLLGAAVGLFGIP